MTRRSLPCLLALALCACAAGPTISARDYASMETVMAAIKAERFQEAEQRLAPLLASPAPYTRGIAYQTLGYVHAIQERHQDAIAAYNSALATGALPADVQAQMLLNIGGLAARAGHCSDAIAAFERWHATTAKPYGRGTHGLVVCYADQNRLEEAAARYAEASADAKAPTAAWQKIGSDLALARQGKTFPPQHFQRTLYDDAYFGTRPVRPIGKCPIEPPASPKGETIEGKVDLELAVDADGRVTAANVVQTTLPEAWNQAVVSALMKCEFKPALENGQPVAGKVPYTYTVR